MGPSTGLPGPVADPVLELHDASTTIATNDNWGDAANKQDVSDVGLNPGSPNESVILTTVPSNTSGVADVTFSYGDSGDLLLAGKWRKGAPTGPGVAR